MTLKIRRNILSQGAPNVPGRKMKPKYITVHNTANTSRGANAEMHARYQHNGSGGRQASWHYTVDDTEIWQTLEDTQQGWHAGDGSGAGNTQSIGIEICENSDGNFDKAVKNAQRLIRKLMNKHGMSINNVVPHKHWSGKNCPRKLLGNWDEFKAGLVEEEKVISAKSDDLFKVQIGAFSKKTNADNLAKRAKARGFDQYIVKEGGLYKVQIGAFSQKANADEAVKKAKKAGFDVYIIGGKSVNKAKAKSSKPSPKPKANLAVDGFLGPQTIRALQRYFGTTVDGVISKPDSLVVRELQKWLGNVAVDGSWGPETTRALQRRLGTPVDGVISRPSMVIKELQRRLNRGKL